MKHDGKVVISTALDNTGLKKGIGSVSGSLGGLKTVLGKMAGLIATAFSVTAIVRFGVESSKAAMDLSNALQGLQSIVEGQGRSFSKAKTFLDEYVKDGLIPMTNAVTAYKNLAARGYDDSQIQQTLIALKDASAFGRQASYSMGEAVQTATEGLKNENSILVDNAGVTKNVSKMWDDYAKSIGTTAANLTQQQKIQAEVTGILEESKFQTGDAAKVAETLSGQLQQLSFNFNNLKVAVGNAINPIVQSLLPVINSAVNALTRFANSIASVVGAIFGKVSVQTEAIAEGASAGAEAEKELADGIGAAGKAAKKAIAGFDELNVLQSNAGSGSGSSAGGGSSTTNSLITAEATVEDRISPKMQAFVDKIKELTAPLKTIDFSPLAESFGRLKESLEPITKDLFAGLEWAWHNILLPISKWTVEDVLPAFLDLTGESLKLLNTTIEGLKPMGIWLWDEFLKPMAKWTGGTLVDSINSLADGLERISKWAEKSKKGINNFLTLIGSIAGAFGVVNIVSQIVSYLSAVAAMAPEVGLLAAIFPKISSAIATLGTFITGTLLPGISSALTAIAGALGISVGWVVAIVAAVGAAVAAIIIYWDEICAFFASAAGWFNTNVIQPIGKFFSGLWTSISQWASDAWKGIKEFFAPAVQWFTELLGSIRQTFSDIFHNIGVIASGSWEIIKAVWGIVSGWFNEKVVQPVSEFFTGLWNGFVEKAKVAWGAVKSVFSKVASFFSDTFREAWEGIVKVFSVDGEIFTDIKDGILTAFKAIVNSLITGLNSVISIPFSGINAALKAIRDITILDYQPFSGLKTINVPQIPHLARGAVIPPNNEFLAVLGDQKHGTNIEAPLSTIQEAVAIAMRDQFSGMMAGFEALLQENRQLRQVVENIEIGDSTIGEAALRYNRKMAVVRG